MQWLSWFVSKVGRCVHRKNLQRTAEIHICGHEQPQKVHFFKKLSISNALLLFEYGGVYVATTGQVSFKS